MFEDGRTDLTDAEIKGRPAIVSTPDMVQRVEDIIRSNCKGKESHTACPKISKSIWEEDNFLTIIRFKQLRTKERYSIIKA